MRIGGRGMRGRFLALTALILTSLGAWAGADPVTAIEVRVEPTRDRQAIDGFGGSLAYWGYNADEATLRQAFADIGATIVRIPGEVSQSGEPAAYREALRRVANVAPRARVYVTFWQPRSQDRPRPEDWLDLDAANKYRLKPAMAGEWAGEMVARIRLIRGDWGANVVAVGVQNEPNFSQPGTPTCAWEPDRLAEFIAREFAPRLAAAGLGTLPIAAPELAYVGAGAGEARRFAPALAGPSTIFSYHMYDSFKQGDADPGLDGLRERQRALGRFLREDLPAKRVWMTETTGAQYNGKEWHTLGWSPRLDEHDKAIAAARYMHAALVDAGANAFLWWGLVYSEAPRSAHEAEERQKFRDEGLILVSAEQKGDRHAFLERTPKSYAFQQFAAFVRPGWVRLDVPEPSGPGAPLVAAFRSGDGREIAVVLIHPAGGASGPVEPRVTGPRPYRRDRAYVTDRGHRCERSAWTGVLPPESVTTLLYAVEAPAGER
jgi:O-glycosyl hydrolase